MRQNDMRVRVTKTMIQQGLLRILQNKSIEGVTIKELVEEAQVNRGTFYLHYATPMDVLKEMENQFVEEKLAKFASYWNGAQDTGMMSRIISIALEDKELCRVLMGEHGDPQFLISLRYLVLENVIDGWQEEHPTIPRDRLIFLFDYVFSGSTRLILDWITDPKGLSAEEFSQRLEQLGHYALLAAESF